MKLLLLPFVLFQFIFSACRTIDPGFAQFVRDVSNYSARRQLEALKEKNEDLKPLASADLTDSEC